MRGYGLMVEGVDHFRGVVALDKAVDAPVLRARPAPHHRQHDPCRNVAR